MPAITSEESEKARIDYAQRIIAGEFKNLVILMVAENDERHCFFEGGRFQAIGLMECAAFEAKMRDCQDE